VDIPPDFVDSHPWPAVLTGRLNVPATPAVYIVAQAQEFGRLRGSSRILYVGSTGQLGGHSQNCRLRIYCYPNGRHALEMKRRTELAVAGGVELSLHWKRLDTKTAAKMAESILLNLYLEEHHELPPFNAHACAAA
jgi:hypothetical protein